MKVVSILTFSVLALCAEFARLVVASDQAQGFTLKSDEVFRAFAFVFGEQVDAGPAILARVTLAFVNFVLAAIKIKFITSPIHIL